MITSHLKSTFSQSIINYPPLFRLFSYIYKNMSLIKNTYLEKQILASNALFNVCRAFIKNSKPEFDEDCLNHHVHFAFLNLPISNKCLEQFKEETRKDPILQTLKDTTEGWPEITLISHELHPRFTYRSAISTMKGYFSKISELLSPVL